MKKQLATSLLFATALFGAQQEATNVGEMFAKGKASGNIKYYYIQTNKDYDTSPSTSADAHSLGGQLSFVTAKLQGLSAKATFMTTNGFALDSNVAKVDTSIIGKDNGAYYGDPARAKDSFSVLGEAAIYYDYAGLHLGFGREVIKTPLIHAKEVRMLPSAVQGAFASYQVTKEFNLGVSYIDKFKHRTSDRFIDVVEHALGSDTKLLTGSNTGSVAMVDGVYKNDALTLKAYDYYAHNFFNSLYLEALYTQKVDTMKFTFGAEYINQMSVGNTDDYLGANPTYAGGVIDVNSLSLKGCMFVGESKFMVAYSKVFRNDGKHDSLVLPWDGTPLYTNMITSNDLFQSIYGSALKSDSVYIGGSQGIKLGYKQGFDFTGVKGFSTVLSFLNTSNSRTGFDKDQRDYNVVLGYKYDKALSVALKGIWVKNNTSADKTGAVTQIKQLTQYRVIANYKF